MFGRRRRRWPVPALLLALAGSLAGVSPAGAASGRIHGLGTPAVKDSYLVKLRADGTDLRSRGLAATAPRW